MCKRCTPELVAIRDLASSLKSESAFAEFSRCCLARNVAVKRIKMDVPTRWNSVVELIDSALDLRAVCVEIDCAHCSHSMCAPTIHPQGHFGVFDQEQAHPPNRFRQAQNHPAGLTPFQEVE